jgi:hypothetical protein
MRFSLTTVDNHRVSVNKSLVHRRTVSTTTSKKQTLKARPSLRFTVRLGES